MPLISLIIVLVVVGAILWATNAYLGEIIDGKILKIINIVVVIAVVLYVLSAFGIFGSNLSAVRVPRIGG